MASPRSTAAPAGPSAFLSHYQATGQLQCVILRELLASHHHATFFDQDVSVLNASVMTEGVEASSLYVLLLTRGVLTRPFVRMEAAQAVASHKAICFIVDTDAARGGAPLADTLAEGAAAIAAAPPAPAGELALDEAALATLVARAGPAIPFCRGEALHTVTLPALLARIAAAGGRALPTATGTGPGAAAPPPYPSLCLRRPKLHTVLPRLGGGAACCGAACGMAACTLLHNERAHLLIVGAGEATDQAEFLALAARARCPWNQVEREEVGAPGAAAAAAAAAGGEPASLEEARKASLAIKGSSSSGGGGGGSSTWSRGLLTAASAAAASAAASATSTIFSSPTSPTSPATASAPPADAITLRVPELQVRVLVGGDDDSAAAAEAPGSSPEAMERTGALAAQSSRMTVVILTRSVFRSALVRGAVRAALLHGSPLQLMWEREPSFGGDTVFANFMSSCSELCPDLSPLFSNNAIKLERSIVMREDALSKLLEALGAFNPEKHDVSETAKGIVKLLTAKGGSDPSFTERYLLTLTALATESASSRDEVNKSGGMEAIIASMRAHERTASVVCVGCSALGELATVSPSLLRALSDAHVGSSTLSLLGSQVGLASSLVGGGLTYAVASKSAEGAVAKEKAVESIRASADTFFAAVGGVVKSSSEAFKNIFAAGTLRRHKLVGLDAPQPGLLALVRALEVFADLPDCVLPAFAALQKCAEGKEAALKAVVARAGMRAILVAWGCLGVAGAGAVVVEGAALLACLLEGPCSEAEAEFLAGASGGGGSGGSGSGSASASASASASSSGSSSMATINALLTYWATAGAAGERDKVLLALCDFLKTHAFAGGAVRKALFAEGVHGTLTGTVGAVATLSALCAAAVAEAAKLIEAEGKGLLGATVTKASSTASSLMSRLGGSSSGGGSGGGGGVLASLPSLPSLPAVGLWGGKK